MISFISSTVHTIVITFHCKGRLVFRRSAANPAVCRSNQRQGQIYDGFFAMLLQIVLHCHEPSFTRMRWTCPSSQIEWEDSRTPSEHLLFEALSAGTFLSSRMHELSGVELLVLKTRRELCGRLENDGHCIQLFPICRNNFQSLQDWRFLTLL